MCPLNSIRVALKWKVFVDTTEFCLLMTPLIPNVSTEYHKSRAEQSDEDGKSYQAEDKEEFTLPAV